MCQFLQHPSARVTFDPPQDPRDPPVQSKVDRVLGTAANGTCVCGIANRKHVGVTGTWLGCETARHVTRRLDYPKDPERWNDPYTAITLKVRAAMVDGSCGPRFEIEMNGYTNDEQLALAATLVRVAVTGYLEGLAK